MPIMGCQSNGRPGYKWGKSGKCYTYNPGSETSRKRAKQKAILQGVAIKKSGYRGDAIHDEKLIVSWLTARGISKRKLRTRLRRKPKRLFIPRTVERGYVKLLRKLVLSWRELYLQIIDPQLESLMREAYLFKPPAAVNVKVDAWFDQLDELIMEYKRGVSLTLDTTKNEVKKVAFDVSNLNLQKWKKVVSGVVGIDLLAREPWLGDQLSLFTRQNTALITKIAEETRADIERIVTNGFQSGKRLETVRKEILSNSKLNPGRFRKTLTRAELIARDQTAKLNGQLSQLRQAEIEVDRYTWRTVGDERVRHSHLVMDGKLCRWDDATVYSDDGGRTWNKRASIGGVELHPGQDYQCRCYPEADFSSILS